MSDSILLKLFKSIDTAFIFYYATSNLNTMTFGQLTSKVAHQCSLRLTLNHLNDIVNIYPNCYTIDTNFEVADDYLIGAPTVMNNSKSRLITFEKLFLKQKNTPKIASNNSTITITTTPLTVLSSTKLNRKRPANEKLESLRKKPSNIESTQLTNSSYTSLLEKIRLKQKLNDLKPKLSEQQKYNNFINGQLENVSSILLTLSRESTTREKSNSYSLQYLTTKLTDSLRCKLSVKEAEDAIMFLSSKIPHFCSVVEVGKVRAVKIHNQTNILDIRQHLACV